jgi:hypothetical protein
MYPKEVLMEERAPPEDTTATERSNLHCTWKNKKHHNQEK